MRIIDAQVHAYERDHPGRPWAGRLPGPAAVTGDDLVMAMDTAGVDQALLVSPWSFYRDDPSYAVEVYNAYPGRFRLIAPIDPYRPGAADAVTAWANTQGAVGIRLMAGLIDRFRSDDPQVTAAIRAADAASFPVCVYCPKQLPLLRELARLHPGTQFVLDHLGLDQPLEPPPPADPFGDLGTVLGLARYPNIAVKVTAACTLSRRPAPFDDLWGPLRRLFDAYGVERCLWGTDWTRTVAFASYPQAVAAFRDHLPLSPGDRTALMGGAVETIFRWPSLPAAGPSGGPVSGGLVPGGSASGGPVPGGLASGRPVSGGPCADEIRVD